MMAHVPDRALARFVIVVLALSLLQAAVLTLLDDEQRCLMSGTCAVDRSSELMLILLRAPVVAASCVGVPFLAGILYPRLAWLLGGVIGGAPLSIGMWLLLRMMFPQMISESPLYTAEDLWARAIVGVFAGTAGQLIAARWREKRELAGTHRN
jgi:hypothetical protein